MVQDMSGNDTTGEVMMYQWSKGLIYSEASQDTVFDWQILAPIEVNATGKNCSVKKNVQNQMNKIFDNNRKYLYKPRLTD